MANLEQLERLVRLRDAGGLTEAEFEAEKLKLLRADQPSSTLRFSAGTLVVSGVVIVALLVVAYLWGGNWRAGGPETDAVQAAPVAASTTAHEVEATAATSGQTTAIGQPVAAAAPQDRSALDFATSIDVIGLNPAYLEKRLGIPREKDETNLVFDVGGCRISYDIEKGRISAFGVDIGNVCRPKIGTVQIGPSTTFGQIMGRQSGGALTATCLWDCGNAADPTIDLVYGGTRINQWIAAGYSTDYQQASNLLRLWEQDVRKRGGISYENDFNVAYEASHCVRNPPASLRLSLLRLKVRSVRVYLDNGTATGNC